jgi:hypothetical protein
MDLLPNIAWLSFVLSVFRFVLFVNSSLHQILPAPGVYDALITELLIIVSHCTTPLNFDIAASTVTIPADTATCDALIVTFADAVIVMPLVSSLIELPLLSTISTAPGPSFSVYF